VEPSLSRKNGCLSPNFGKKILTNSAPSRSTRSIPFAGDGRLRDGSATSAELRELLSLVPLEMLSRYADQCLQESFTDSGLALQDIVNQSEFLKTRGVSSFSGKRGMP
jgi:hypothetical protein